MILMIDDNEKQFIITTTITAIETTLAIVNSEELTECQRKTATEILDNATRVLKKLGFLYDSYENQI